MPVRSPARAPRRRVPALTNDPSSLFQPPEVVGPFRVRRALASGTLGPRLLVEDDRGRLQVLKLITEVADDADALVRVLDHVRRSLPAHPGLLPVTDVGVSPDGVYLVSPVVNAPSVEGRLRGGRQSLDATLEWLRGVAAGLQAAHDAGVWHGAIHPRDVLVGDEGGLLTGIGVAPALEHLALQAPVRVPYTAPERASGQRWDARADQYSLAMLALDALSGRRLIAGTIPAFDRWTLAETPTEDARLHEVFVRALHPDPTQRYGSLDEWLAALAGAPEAQGKDGALSRFAREGVILATPAAAEAAGRDIEVQRLEDPEGVALSLFPEEDGTIESPVAESPAPVIPSAPETEAAEAEAEQEWLVADVPHDEVPVAGDGYLLRHAEESHSSDPVVPVTSAPAWRLDDGDEVDTATPAWASGAEEEGTRRGPWLLLVAALVLAALGYGTWRSLQGPAAPATDTAATPTPGEAASADAPSSAGAASGASDEADRATPAPRAPSTATERAAETRAVPQAPVPPREPAREPSRPPRESPPAAPAADAADTAADATPAPGTGRVLIRSSPTGEVRVNGRVRGETPVVLRDLPFGSYVISVSRPGFAPVERAVDLLPTQPVASVTVDLVRQGAEVSQPPSRPVAAAPPTPSVPGVAADPARPAPSPAADAAATRTPASPTRAAQPDARTGSIFVVSTPPQARLYVDGQLYGSTPAAIPGLAPGAHAVRVEAAGYRPWQGQVEVMPGTRTRVQATLQQEQE